MELKNLEVLAIHKYPEFLQQCCELINEEWSRSETARMMMLKSSCDSLPTSLILISDRKLVLGHCKLTRIPSIPQSVFLETVVIRKGLRGMKLGTLLMNEVENYCKNVLKLKMVHLSTKGQENFYAKLGYKLCGPITIYGSAIGSNNSKSVNTTSKNDKPVPKPINVINDAIPPPPPPPPMPNNNNIYVDAVRNTTYMFKYLSM